MIYLGSCLLIYLVERPKNQGQVVATALAAVATQTDKPSLGISPLVKCECLIIPIRRADLILQRTYDDLFNQFKSLDISEEVYLLAAELRARFGLKTPDALHLACAQHHGCEELWTNDDRLTRGAHRMARNIFSPPVL